jgi:hypothetical protein
MAIKGSVFALSTVNNHRQRCRDRPGGRRGDELAKAGSLHHGDNRILIFFAEGGRDVHVFAKSLNAIEERSCGFVAEPVDLVQGSEKIRAFWLKRQQTVQD